ncbi:MAG: gliding motility-associated C-terminal domain-containing protein [Alphaproteobacteria bacterium]|nr:gliding motility-associated C-terminal domain-containing protein [Alphaproteobacteria bacterium]
MKKIITTPFFIWALLFIINPAIAKESTATVNLNNQQPQFLPYIYQPGNSRVVGFMDNRKIESNQSWDFEYYRVFKLGSNFYRIGKFYNNEIVTIDSCKTAIQAYNWFQNIKIKHSNIKDLQVKSLIYPEAFLEQKKQFTNSDSVWVYSPKAGILVLVDSNFIVKNNQYTATDILNLPATKMISLPVEASQDISLPLQYLESGAYKLVLINEDGKLTEPSTNFISVENTMKDNSFINLSEQNATKTSNTVLPSNIITLNQNGQATNWIIGNIKNFPENNIKIYTTHGQLVKELKNYQNNWHTYSQDLSLNSNQNFFYFEIYTRDIVIAKGMLFIVK